MALIRPAAVWLATAVTAPALYQAFVTETLDVTSALTRFLIAVPAAGLALAALRFVTAGYGKAQESTPARRHTDPQHADVVPDPPD